MTDKVDEPSSDKSNNGNGRITVKDPATKLAHKRLSVLQLTESLGSVIVHPTGSHITHTGSS